MAFKPLKDDEELNEVIDDLSRISEECALATEAVNRSTRAAGMTPAGPLAKATMANTNRKATKRKLLTIINERLTSAYNAGLQDGNMQYEKRGP